MQKVNGLNQQEGREAKATLLKSAEGVYVCVLMQMRMGWRKRMHAAAAREGRQKKKKKKRSPEYIHAQPTSSRWLPI